MWSIWQVEEGCSKQLGLDRKRFLSPCLCTQRNSTIQSGILSLRTKTDNIIWYRKQNKADDNESTVKTNIPPDHVLPQSADHNALQCQMWQSWGRSCGTATKAWGRKWISSCWLGRTFRHHNHRLMGMVVSTILRTVSHIKATYLLPTSLVKAALGTSWFVQRPTLRHACITQDSVPAVCAFLVYSIPT